MRLRWQRPGWITVWSVPLRQSPTLLIDGADPFAGPDTRASMSCRLYRDAAGRIAGGAPSVEALRQALAEAVHD